MKTPLLTLLPIAFLFVACGGHEQTASVPSASTDASAVPTVDTSATAAPVATPAPTPLPATPNSAVGPDGKTSLAVTNYQAAHGARPNPIIIEQHQQRPVNLAEVLASVPRISAQDAKAKVDSGSALILDVRTITPTQIKGARHISLAQMPFMMKDLPHDKQIITYCTCPHEEEATRAALMLKQAGFKAPVALGGGLRAWEQAGYPIQQAQ